MLVGFAAKYLDYLPSEEELTDLVIKILARRHIKIIRRCTLVR
jgi:hypothetical protein